MVILLVQAALRALAGGRLVFLVVVVHGLSLPWFGRFPRPWVVLFFGRMTVGHLVRSPLAGGVAHMRAVRRARRGLCGIHEDRKSVV